MIVAGTNGKPLAIDQDTGRLVCPDFDWLVGERRSAVVNQRQVGLVAGDALVVVSRLGGIVEVLQELRIDDEVAQPLQGAVHPNGVHLAGESRSWCWPPRRSRRRRSPVRGRRKCDERGPLRGDSRDVTTGRIEGQQARRLAFWSHTLSSTALWPWESV